MLVMARVELILVGATMLLSSRCIDKPCAGFLSSPHGEGLGKPWLIFQQGPDCTGHHIGHAILPGTTSF